MFNGTEYAVETPDLLLVAIRRANCNKNTVNAQRRFVERGKYGSIRRESNNSNFTQSN